MICDHNYEELMALFYFRCVKLLSSFLSGNFASVATIVRIFTSLSLRVKQTA